MPVESLQSIVDHFIFRVDDHLQKRRRCVAKGPFFLCISGLQGSGKSTLARQLQDILHEKYHLKVVGVSIDDFYHSHNMLVKVCDDNPGNALLKTRGQPGTHDERLADGFFASLLATSDDDIRIPFFDKSRFDGEGDRLPVEKWEKVSRSPPVDVVIFEGWCVGFQAVNDEELEQNWKRANDESVKSKDEDEQKGFSTITLSRHSLEHLRTVNANLRRYNDTFMKPSNFSYLVHLDTDRLVNVYTWRLDQEYQLRLSKGTGMTDEEVVRFVQGYMPAYELYLERLRNEPFVPPNTHHDRNTQLRVILEENRSIRSITQL
jgi:D-glycerate 3-kinase